MSTVRPMRAEDLLRFDMCNLDPLTETYNISFYLGYLAKWPSLCNVIVSETDDIEGYILGKVEDSPHMKATSYPYNPDTNKNPHYLPWHAHITALTVAPSLRRMGHARKLTEILEQQGEASDAWFVDLYVRVDNLVAQKLYKSMGYSVYRRVVDYYSDDMDAFDMRKSLRRDVDNKHVRENGEDFKVSPNDVW